MVLVDTSIWVAHFRSRDPRLQALLHNAQVMIHPFVLGELACGNLKGRKEILPLLSALPSAPLVDQEEAFHFIERHRLMGIGIGFIDVHLLASAQLAHALFWTSDGRLARAAWRLSLFYESAHPISPAG